MKLVPSGRADVLDGVKRALIEQQRLFMHRLEDRLGQFMLIDPLFASAVNFTGGGAGCDRSAGGAGEPRLLSPSLGDAVGAYLSAKRTRWTAKTHASRTRQLGYLQEHLGEATLLSAITSHDVRSFRDAVCRIRRNDGRACKRSFAEKQTESIAHRIDGKTAVLIFEPTKAFFKWATAEQGYIERNPAEDVRNNAPQKAKGKRS